MTCPNLLRIAVLSSRKVSLILACSGCETVRRAYRRCTSHSILLRFRGLCRYSWNFSEPKYSRSVSSRIVASFCESNNNKTYISKMYENIVQSDDAVSVRVQVVAGYGFECLMYSLFGKLNS